MTDERLCKCDLCKEEFDSTGTDWHFGADLIQCKAINICDGCWHHGNGHWATWSEIEYALSEVKRLREIVKKQEERFDVLRRFERRMYRTYTVYCSHDDEYSEADPCGTIGRLVDRVTEISNMVIE